MATKFWERNFLDPALLFLRNNAEWLHFLTGQLEHFVGGVGFPYPVYPTQGNTCWNCQISSSDISMPQDGLFSGRRINISLDKPFQLEVLTRSIASATHIALSRQISAGFAQEILFMGQIACPYDDPVFPQFVYNDASHPNHKHRRGNVIIEFSSPMVGRPFVTLP